MLATTFAIVIFTASANRITPVNWQTDYAKAYTQAIEKHRPLAVFIGEGARAGVNETNGKKLTQDFICVYVDANTEAGKKLAASFEMTQGLIISNRTGDKQALRLSGAVSTDDLTQSLDRFAKTETVTTTATSPYPVYVAPPVCTTGNCPFAR